MSLSTALHYLFCYKMGLSSLNPNPLIESLMWLWATFGPNGQITFYIFYVPVTQNILVPQGLTLF